MLCYDPEVGNRNLEKDDAIVLSSRATETHEVFEKFHRHCSLAPTRCLIRITACCTALVGLARRSPPQNACQYLLTGVQQTQ